MIREAQGNLLGARVDALVNTVNTVGIMGKGIALQFKRAYPAMYSDYARAAKAGAIQPGHVYVWETESLDGPRFVINFPTKRHWRSPSTIEYIETGLVDLVDKIRELRIESIAIPPLGCGNGGLSWATVRPLIVDALSTLGPDVDVLIYPPNGAPVAADMLDSREQPTLTPGRAALLRMMIRYVDHAAEVPSQIEVQKLMYFLQVVAGEPLRLNYGASYYGPYADNLRHVLKELEGHYISGFGDGSSKVHESEPLQLLSEASEADLDKVLSEATSMRTEKVLAIIAGYESPFGLELLSTVHWVMTHDKAAKDSPGRTVEAVQSWNQRKRSTFSSSQVEKAWLALRHRLTPQGEFDLTDNGIH